MKNIRFMLVLGMCIILIGMLPNVCSAVTKISVDELFQMLEEPETVIIDARKNSDWEKSNRKIQGAVRENPWKTEEWFPDYPKDKKYVLYCA